MNSQSSRATWPSWASLLGVRTLLGALLAFLLVTRTLLVAPGLTTRSKKLLGAPSEQEDATRNKDTPETRSSKRERERERVIAMSCVSCRRNAAKMERLPLWSRLGIVPHHWILTMLLNKEGFNQDARTASSKASKASLKHDLPDKIYHEHLVSGIRSILFDKNAASKDALKAPSLEFV